MRYILLLLPAILLSIPVYAQNWSDSLTAAMEQLATETSFVGGALAIVDADGVHYAQGFGYADKAAGRKYTHKTVQPIASVSKPWPALR